MEVRGDERAGFLFARFRTILCRQLKRFDVPSDLDRGTELNAAIGDGVAVFGMKFGPQQQARCAGLGFSFAPSEIVFDIARDRAEHAADAPRFKCSSLQEWLAVALGRDCFSVADIDFIHPFLGPRDTNSNAVVLDRMRAPMLPSCIESSGSKNRRRVRC